MKFDVCVIGSGAGAGPIVYELAKAGYSVVVLEKGPFVKTSEFRKDDLMLRRKIHRSNIDEEFHEVLSQKDGQWKSQISGKGGRGFWNGNLVGGSSNFMSGYFHRLKPKDFKLAAEFQSIEGANIVDWPISYDDLEPYYAKVESEVGVSGEVKQHRFLEPRSTPDLPYEKLKTNPFGKILDEKASQMGFELFESPRAIITNKKGERNPCYYSEMCGSYGCSSGAKGSSRVALIEKAIDNGNCEVRADSKVYLLEEEEGIVVAAHYYDANGISQRIEAGIFVVACQAIESSRLLLSSQSDRFPNGLGNNSGQVGKNLIFSSGGVGSGEIYRADFSADEFDEMKRGTSFLNRCLQQWYEIEEGSDKFKGGTIDFIIEHPNPITKASKQRYDEKGNLLIGSELKEALRSHFVDTLKIKFEIFVDWSPNDDCSVELSDDKDKWGDRVGKVKLGHLEYDKMIADRLADRAMELLSAAGVKNLKWKASSSPPSNLQAGGCRFGDDPTESVLDRNCKSHEVDNLYVTDGSFMPNGGSVPHTFTIYANSFRVADHLVDRLENERNG